jgi:transcriptional regulator with XRE-family HTH domain
MGNEPSRISKTLALLRKEKNISQKQAAADLGVSQALLSHYEKGIRECGLDFLVRAADYYDVSCDFLLGRSPQRTGAVLTIDDIPDSENERGTGRDLVALMQKKLLSNSLTVLFDQLALLHNNKMTLALSSFLNMAVYRCYRMLFCAPKNGPQLFNENRMNGQAKADAIMRVAEAQANSIADEYGSEKENPIPVLTNELLETQYPKYAASVLNILKNSEEQL